MINKYMEWLIESLRVSLFSNDNVFEPSTNWWESVTGKEPEERITKVSPQFLREVGKFPDQSSNLALELTSGRIDWFLVPDLSQLDTSQQLPNVGKFDDAVEKFVNLIINWIDHSPDIHRIALGVILLNPVKDKISGYELIAPLLHSVNIDPIGSTDFFYSINRPRISETEGETISINRASRWSVAELTYLKMSPPIRLSRQDGVFTIRLELDINTSANHIENISKARIKLLLTEFIKLSKELSIKGDIP